MTLTEILTAAASVHSKALADLTVNSQNLGLVALNNARRAAEMQYDFEFTRKLVTVSVNGVTGGSLAAAVAYGTVTPVLEVGTIVDVGLFDQDGNLWPVSWTTIGASMERSRNSSKTILPRYPTDEQILSWRGSDSRFTFSGDSVYVFPRDSSHNFTLGIECYVVTPDWVSGDLSGSPAPWATHGAQYLLWSIVSELNPMFQTFLFRQEGNVGEQTPDKKADTALTRLHEWDIMRFEQLRRHV